MANIYDGTFVLGNTSATTLSAGPGIKLDTSVPGTIGISNDETVLWENSAGAGTATNFILSENYKNFERLRFEYRPWSTAETPTYQFSELGTNYDNFTLGSVWNNNNVYATFIHSFKGNGSAQIDFLRGAYNNSNSWSTAGMQNFAMYKIVGINRISGGN